MVAIRLFDGTLVELGAGYVDPVAIVSLTDGLRLAVAESGGAILVVGRDAAGRRHARLLAQLPNPVLGLDEHPDAGSLLVLSAASDGGDLPQLLQCDLETGDVGIVSADIDGARSLVVDPDRRSAIVLSVLADGSRTLTTVGLDDGVVDTFGTEDYDHFASAPVSGAQAVFATRPDPAAPGNDALALWEGAEVAVEPLPGRVDGLTRWGSLLLIACGADLHAVEWDVDEGQLPVAAPLGPLAVTGYARLRSTARAGSRRWRRGLRGGKAGGRGRGSFSLGVQPLNPDGRSRRRCLRARCRCIPFQVTSVADNSTLAVRCSG